VRFASYIWKRIDGFILDSIKKEVGEEKYALVTTLGNEPWRSCGIEDE